MKVFFPQLRSYALLTVCVLGFVLHVKAQVPSITGFSPGSGPVGTAVTITGSNFTDALQVRFRGVGAAFTVISPTEISTAVPVGALTGTISVSNLKGTGSSPTNFVVIQPPVITSFFPPSGVIGSTVDVYGRGLADVTSLTFNGVPATFSVVSPYNLMATVPVGATTGPIEVASVAGSFTSTIDYVVTPPKPTITAFSPTMGPVGQSVSITGTDFLDATSVKLKGISVPFTVNSATDITITIPAGAISGLLAVTTAGGTALSATRFTVVPPPTITSFAPTSGLVGTQILVQGTDFVNVTSVKFNNVSASFTPIASRSLWATVPAGATTGLLEITALGGTALSATDFVVNSSNPFITSFSPASGNAAIGGTPGTLVTINGGNFMNGGTQVFFNGAPSTAITYVSNGRIRAIVPGGASTGPIRVHTVNGDGLSATDFVVNNANNTPPTMTPIAAQRACGGSTITVPYTIGDAQTDPANLIVTGAASPGSIVAVVADAGGSGANRFATIQALNPAAGGTATVTLTVTDELLTVFMRSFSVTFDAPLVVTAGPNHAVLLGVPVALNGTTNVAAQTQWTTSGTGTFDNDDQLATNYNPSVADYLAGSVTLTLSGTPTAPSTCGPASGAVVITFTRPDLVVSSPQNVNGLYHNITVVNGGAMTVDGALDVNGTLTVQAGGLLTFDSSCPVITGSGDFVLQAGATMSICHPQGIATTGAAGQVQMTGSRSFSGGASYSYDASSTQETGSGLPFILTGDLSVRTTAGVDLSQDLGIKHTLYLDGGDLRQGSSNLTILSDAGGTGMVVNFTGEVIGTATVERYIDPTFNSGVGYRHLSSPVTNTNFLDLATAGYTPVVNSAYNSTVTPGGTNPYPTVFGYNEQRFPLSRTFELGYFSPNALSDQMEWGRGYSAYMLGGIKPDFVGTLGNGSVTHAGLTRTNNFTANTEKSGWHLLGNPYPSPIDWDLVTIPSGLSNAVSVYHSTGNTHLAGSYQVYVNGVGQPGTDLIGIAQGFFVRVTSAGPVSFTLTNACRVTEYADASVYRAAAETRPVLGLTLAAANAPAEQAADAYVYFQNGATAGFDDAFDGARPGRNVGIPTLATVVGDEELAINALAPTALTGTRLPLLVDVPAAGSYQFGVKQFINLPADVTLYDALTRTSLPVNEAFRYGFTAATAGEQAARFSLIFGKIAPVATAERLSAYPNPATGTVRVAGTSGKPVELLDALGRVVRTQQVATGAETVVNLTGVPAGVYLVRAGGQTTRLVVE